MDRILDFKPAQLHIQKNNWEVVYYALNPLTSKLQRIRIKVNHIKNTKDRREFANKLIADINRKLVNGWNPFVEQEAKLSFTKLTDAFEKFLTVKTKELRKSTIKSYERDINQFYEYLQKHYKISDLYIFSINKSIAIEFLNYKYIDQGITERTYNNYLTDFVAIWNWLLENNYVNANVWQGIKHKKEREKVRKLINPAYLKEIFDYTKENDKQFNAIILIAYYCLIRPNEIIHLKGTHIDFDQNLIFIPSQNSKTGISRYVTLNNVVKQALLELNIHQVKNQYLFSEGFLPGNIPITAKAITSKWDRLRKKLNMPKDYQFYSLKDTGIVNLLRKGIPINIVRDQAGHTNIATTNKYVQKYLHNTSNELLNFE